MKRLSKWYKDLNLSKRVILSMNATIFVSILAISVFATLNRIRIQKSEAGRVVNNEIDQLITLLDFSGTRELSDFAQVIYSKYIYNTGYISFISSDGEVLLCRHRENQNISDTEHFRHIQGRQKGSSYFTNPATNLVNYQFFEFYQARDMFIVITLEKREFIDKPVRNTQMVLLFALIFSFVALSLVNYFTIKTVTKPVNGLKRVVQRLSLGELPERFNYNHKDEIGQMALSVNGLVDGLKQTSEFAQEIGKNNFDYPFKPLSDNDVLGNALLEMRHSLKSAMEYEKVRKVEDEKRNWVTQGLAMFGDILRQNNDNMEELSFNIINNLVAYLGINQGGLFIYMDEEESKGDGHLELTACYAFNRKKYLQKKTMVGEGLVGTCFLEKETIYLTKIPRDYIKITSGLGGENPGSLLLVPLKLNEKVFGVVELASFKPFEKYQIEFVEKIGESIASTISSVKINSKTAMLLEISQQQAENMKSQEEEMRQNMEELTATQEAMAENEKENLQAIKRLTGENTKMQEVLALKEKELADTIEECPDAVVKINDQKEILLFNKPSEQLWGYQREEVVGKNVQILFPVGSSFVNESLNGFESDSQIKSKSGTLIMVRVKLTQTNSRSNSVITGYFREISHGLNKPEKPLPGKLEGDVFEPMAKKLNPLTTKKVFSKKTSPTEKKESAMEALHKAEETDTQKAWVQHMDQKGKQFKKGRKK